MSIRKGYLGPIVVAFALSLLPLAALTASNFGQGAPDFPLGAFSDGNHYRVSDFKGKVLVLFFYETACPKCRGTIPERNKLVEKYKDQPVKFIAVGAHEALPSVMDYIQGTRLVMPTFADPFSVMEKRYGESISLSNITQFKVIAPDGKVVGLEASESAMKRGLENAQWTFKKADYDPGLSKVLDLLEWNQYEAGMKALAPLRTSSAKKPLAESAGKLYDVMKAEGQKWKELADTETEKNPIHAYDLYTRITACFPKDDLAKSVEAPLKKLTADPAVKDELEARKMYAQLDAALQRATLAQKNDVIGFCKKITAKYPKTPTGEKVDAYLKELTAK